MQLDSFRFTWNIFSTIWWFTYSWCLPDPFFGFGIRIYPYHITRLDPYFLHLAGAHFVPLACAHCYCPRGRSKLYYIIFYLYCIYAYIYRQYRYPQKEVELLFQDGIDDIYPIMSFLGFQLLYLFLGLLWVDRIWTLQKSSLKWLYLFTFHIVSTPRWFYSWPWFTIYGLLCIRTHTHIYHFTP